jgi:hypothetical protein
MQQQIHHHKGNLLRDYSPGVLYVVTFYAIIRFSGAVYINFITGASGAVSYQDNFTEMPVLASVIYLVFCLASYYANRKTFEIIKKESFSLWMKHLGIDIFLYSLCILLTAGYENFVEKTDPALRNAGLSIVIVFMFYCKHEGMRRWHRRERRKLRVVR